MEIPLPYAFDLFFDLKTEEQLIAFRTQRKAELQLLDNTIRDHNLTSLFEDMKQW